MNRRGFVFMTLLILVVAVVIYIVYLGVVELKCQKQMKKLCDDYTLKVTKIRTFDDMKKIKIRKVSCPYCNKEYLWLPGEPEPTCPFHGVIGEHSIADIGG